MKLLWVIFVCAALLADSLILRIVFLLVALYCFRQWRRGLSQNIPRSIPSKAESPKSSGTKRVGIDSLPAERLEGKALLLKRTELLRKYNEQEAAAMCGYYVKTSKDNYRIDLQGYFKAITEAHRLMDQQKSNRAGNASRSFQAEAENPDKNKCDLVVVNEDREILLKSEIIQNLSAKPGDSVYVDFHRNMITLDLVDRPSPQGNHDSEKDSQSSTTTRTERTGELPSAQSIAAEVITYLDQVIDNNIDDFEPDGSYKVRPDYGYAKFYLDSVEGSYDMSLQGLIHYIMNDEEIYEKFLSDAQLDGVRDCIENYPEAIYSVDTREGNGEEVETLLDEVYYRCICHVARRLKKAGLNVDAFSDFLDEEEDEDDRSNENRNDNLTSTSNTSRITSAEQVSTNQAVKNSTQSLDIKPLGIQRSSGAFSVNVLQSSISEPDDDDDISVNLNMSLANSSEDDIELVFSKFIVLNCSGLPLLEREDEHEVLITNGSSEDVELYSGYFKSNLLGVASPSDTQVLVQFMPCGCRFIELPAIDVPPTGNLSGMDSVVQILPELSLQGLSIYAPQPDDDGDCNLEFKGLIANESNISLLKLVITIKITDRNGREIEKREWSEKVPPFSTASFDSSLWGIKSSKLEGAKAIVSIKAFHSLGYHEMSWSVGNPPTPNPAEPKRTGGIDTSIQPKAASPAQVGDRAEDLNAIAIKEQVSPSFNVAITTATYQPPDDDGDTRFEIQYCLTNQSNQPIELLLSRLFVLHPSGLLVATTEDETEDMAESGESINATISTWGTSARELDSIPRSAQLLLQVTACSCSYQDLGSIDCPIQGGLGTMMLEPQGSNGLRVEAISITTDPPDDGECRINIKALIRNNSNLSIPKIVFESKMMSASGRQLEDTSSQEEIEANGSIIIEDSFWGIKENRLNSARLHFSLKAFTSLGTSKTGAINLVEEDQ